MKSSIQKLLPLIVILGVYFLFSFLTYKNYGVTDDENVNYAAGKALLYSYQHGVDPPNSSLLKRFLPSQSTHFRLYPAILTILNPIGYHEWFHLLNMLFASVIFIVMYIFIFLETNNWKLSTIGVLALVLTPRFFGDMPGNPKDVPFATMYLISLLAIYVTTKYKLSVWKTSLILGILFGVTQSMRIVGVSLFIIYALYLVITTKLEKSSFFKTFSLLSISFLVSILFMYIAWPFIRFNFPMSLVTVLTQGAHFDYWDGTMLYIGKFYTSSNIPLGYLFRWILISTPLVIFLPLILYPIVAFIKKIGISNFNLLFVLSLAVTLLVYVVVKPVVYNGIRHFLFLLPVLCILSVSIGSLIYENVKSKAFRLIFILLLVINSVLVFRFYLKFHPYEYIYFNELVGGVNGAKTKYDLDYWGTTYKEAAEWLRINIPDSKTYLKVAVCDSSESVAYYSHSKFIVVGSKQLADYLICDYTSDLLSQDNHNYPILYEVSRDDVVLNVVRKISR